MKKTRINIIDILLVFIVIFFCYSFYSEISTKYESASPLNKIPEFAEVVIEVEGINANYLRNIKTGDAVADLISGNIVGEISNVKSDEYKKFHSIIGDSVVYPERLNAQISINCRIDDTDGYISSSGIKLIIGEEYHFTVPGLSFVGKCSSIKRNISAL